MHRSGRPWILAETDWSVVSETDYDVAILPWGATEAHNYHLPYATDVYESEAIAAEAARLAWERGTRALVLPAIPFGVNVQQIGIPGTINMNPSTMASVLADVIDSLDVQEMHRLVILNGHGGNDFRAMIRELQRSTDVFLSTVSWFRIPGTQDGFDDPGDHAGELETSLMLHLRPDLVRPLEEAGAGRARAWRLRAIREGWAWAPRRWTEVTEDTGVGDPSAATPAKGANYFRAVTAKIAEYLVELASIPPDALYEPFDDETGDD